MKKVCIVGGGNIGIACAVDLSLKKEFSVIIYTHKAKNLPNYFTKVDTDKNLEVKSNFIEMTDDANIAFNGASIVLVTLPSFLIENFVKEVAAYNPEIIFYIPGYGSKELFSKPLVEKRIAVAGLERVPYIARLHNSTTVYASKKKEISCAALDSNKTEYACKLLEDFFDIPCVRIRNYLTVSFTPSNPILHTSRLYSMFKNCTLNTEIPNQIKFYADWNNESSENLISMDKELENICGSFADLDLSQFKTIREHYESFDVESMTKKLSSIHSLKNIFSLLRKNEHDTKYFIDASSRYFREDFPFGLCILRGFAEIANVKTPCMDKVLKWYEKVFGVEYFDSDGNFQGRDLVSTGISQNFGITTMEDVNKFYMVVKNGGGGVNE